MRYDEEKLVEALAASMRGDYWATELVRAACELDVREDDVYVRDEFRRRFAGHVSQFEYIVSVEINGEIRYILNLDPEDDRIEWTSNIDAAEVFTTEQELVDAEKFAIVKLHEIQPDIYPTRIQI